VFFSLRELGWVQVVSVKSQEYVCVCFAYKFASFFLGLTKPSWFSLQHKKHLNKDNGTHMCLDLFARQVVLF